MAARFVPIIIQIQGAQQGQTAVVNLGNAFKGLDSDADRAGSHGLRNASSGMTSAFVAADLLSTGLHKVFDWIKQGIVDTTLFAGRTEELTIALHQLAKANGISADEIDKQLNGLIKLNIGRQEATGILSQMIGANLDLSKASQLARVAQDTAVISGKNSSEAFVALTNAILLGNTEAFRSAGIFLSVGDALDKGAKALGLNKDALSEQQRTQILTNATLEYGARVTGTYEAAMGSASKQMRSLARVHDDAKDAVGGLFQGAFSVGVKVTGALLKLIAQYPGSFAAVTASVVALTLSLVLYNTQLIPSLLSGGAGLVGMFKSLIFWTVNWRVALTDAQVAASLLSGWAAVAIAVGVVIIALTNQASAAEAANKITLEQIESQRKAWEASKILAAAAGEVALAQEGSADRHQKLNAVLGQLDPTTRAYIESLNAERDRVAALNVELERNAALHRAPLVATLRVEGGGILEQMAGIEAASARIAGIEEQIRKEQELLAREPSWAATLRPAIQSLSADIVDHQTKRDNLSKALKENELKFLANSQALGLNREQMLLLFQQAGHTAPEVSKLAEVYDRLTGRTNETTEALKSQALALRDVKKEIDALLKTGTAEIDSKVLDIVKQARERGLSAAEAQRMARDASGPGTVLNKLIKDRREIIDTEKRVRDVFEPKAESKGTADRAARDREIISAMKAKIDDLAADFMENFGRALPARFGQGGIHTRQSMDHRAAADISLDARTEEGRFVMKWLDDHNINAWASLGPSVSKATGKTTSTGVHIHAGEFSGATGRALKMREGLLSPKAIKEAQEQSEYVTWQQEFQLRQKDRVNGPIVTTDSTETQLPIEIQRQWDLYYESAKKGEDDLRDRREDYGAEYSAAQRNMVTEIGNLNLDLRHFQQQAADDQFSEQRRLLSAKQEEVGLTRDIIAAQDELANGPLNESLRIQLALLQDISQIRRRDEEAIKDKNRAELELADATIYHAVQADAAVLKFLASQRSVTEVIADAKIGVIQTTFDLIDRGLDKFTSKLGVIGSLVKDLLSGFIRLELSKFFQSAMGGGGQQQSQGSGGGGIMGFIRNLFSGGLRSGGGSAPPLPQGVLTGGGGGGGYSGAGFTGSGGIGNLGSLIPNPFSGFLAGGGITAPVSTSAAAQSQGILSQLLGGGGSGAASLASLAATAGPIAIAVIAAQTLISSFSGKLSNFEALAGGGLLAFFINRNARRRNDEKTRNQAMIDSLAQLDEIIRAVKSDRMDGTSAIASAMEVRSQYVTAMTALKDGKTRGIALKDVSRLDLKIAEIKGATEGQQRRRDIEKHLVPEFALGGLVPYGNTLFSMATGLTAVKLRPGEQLIPPGGGFGVTVPGVDHGRDSVYAMVPPRTRVLTKAQQSRAQGFAGGGTVGGDGGWAQAPIIIEEVSVDIDSEGIVRVGMKARGNREVVIKNVRSAMLNREL